MTEDKTQNSPPIFVDRQILIEYHDALDFAKELAKFIRDQKLSIKIKNKDFVMVEGWQFAGMHYGLVPIARKPERIETKTDEIRYGCEVDLIRISTGQRVGYGYSMCSNKEEHKGTHEEFKITSMAQTRAISKAYRNLMSWLIKAAGFEPTPAEEMQESNGEVEPIKKPEVKQTATPKKDTTETADKVEDLEEWFK